MNIDEQIERSIEIIKTSHKHGKFPLELNVETRTEENVELKDGTTGDREVLRFYTFIDDSKYLREVVFPRKKINEHPDLVGETAKRAIDDLKYHLWEEFVMNQQEKQ